MTKKQLKKTKDFFERNDLKALKNYLRRIRKQEGFNVNTQDYFGHTMLFYAALEDNIEMYNYLLSIGVDENITNQIGVKAEYWFKVEGDDESIEEILSRIRKRYGNF